MMAQSPLSIILDPDAPSHQHPTPALENQPSPDPTNTRSQPGSRPKGVITRQTPKNAVTARICILYRDFSARSDSRFTTSEPMHRTPIKTGAST